MDREGFMEKFEAEAHNVMMLGSVPDYAYLAANAVERAVNAAQFAMLTDIRRRLDDENHRIGIEIPWAAAAGLKKED